ncbi:type II toxin-antitoxin system prevent-host-death family antitoxin [Streptomyces sp. NPDC020298]|uniref:type II toxin-antitoxin system Phd/YefM family antitoxin n=1 Tax=unclassified Streptomyces TaxID=2593676 RepID=UPI0033DCE2D1
MSAQHAQRQYNVHDAKTNFSRILQLVETGEEIIISRAGEPVAKVVPFRPTVNRTDYGTLRGQVHIPEDFDELPDDIADTFGMR